MEHQYQEQNASAQATHPPMASIVPNEIKKIPLTIILPDGVSPPIQHPLDPLNAGTIYRNRYKKIQILFILFFI